MSIQICYSQCCVTKRCKQWLKSESFLWAREMAPLKTQNRNSAYCTSTAIKTNVSKLSFFYIRLKFQHVIKIEFLRYRNFANCLTFGYRLILANIENFLVL